MGDWLLFIFVAQERDNVNIQPAGSDNSEVSRGKMVLGVAPAVGVRPQVEHHLLLLLHGRRGLRRLPSGDVGFKVDDLGIGLRPAEKSRCKGTFKEERWFRLFSYSMIKVLLLFLIQAYFS